MNKSVLTCSCNLVRSKLCSTRYIEPPKLIPVNFMLVVFPFSIELLLRRPNFCEYCIMENMKNCLYALALIVCTLNNLSSCYVTFIIECLIRSNELLFVFMLWLSLSKDTVAYATIMLLILANDNTVVPWTVHLC